MAAAPKIARSSPAGTIDKPFVLAFIAGAIVIAFFRRGFTDFALIGAELILLAIMLSYIAWHRWGTLRYQGREDKLGDHVYYLGFLLTLTSLLLALFYFSQSENPTEGLVRTFGFALMTTLFGMLLRTVLYQLHGEQEVNIETAMQQFGAQVNALTRQLYLAGQTLVGAITNSQQVFSDTLDRLKTLLGQSEEALAAVVKQMNDLAARLAAVEIPKDLLAQKLTPLTRSLNNNATRIDQATTQMAGGIDKLNGVLVALDTNSAGLNATMLKLLSVHDELDPLLELIRRICGEVDNLGAQLAKSGTSITSAAASSADTLRRVADQSAQDAELVARNRASLDGELARIRTIAGETAAAFGPLAAWIREREKTELDLAKDYRAELDRQRDSYRAELDRQLAQVRELHDELQTHAVSLVKFISDKIGNGRPVA